MNGDGRGTCPVCKRRPMLRGDGLLRGHNDKPIGGRPCRGWLQLPVDQQVPSEVDVTSLARYRAAGRKRAVGELLEAIERARCGSVTVLVDKTGKRLARLGPVDNEEEL